MQAHALRTFLNSSTGQLQYAGSSFEAPDDYAKALEQRGIVKTGSPPEQSATPQPARTQAMSAAPSTINKGPVAPMTSGSITGAPPPAGQVGRAATAQPLTASAPGKKSR